jgi:predicted enzyme related to lactoylglutathione lyase
VRRASDSALSSTVREQIMLNESKVTANIPAADLERARRFYADKLGLTPTQENDGGLVYTTGGGTTFFVYQTEYAGQAGHTIAQFHVGDVDAAVADLKSQGLTFEHYDLPGVTWDGDVASIPEMGRAAWFKDSEGNILCLDDATVP